MSENPPCGDDLTMYLAQQMKDPEFAKLYRSVEWAHEHVEGNAERLLAENERLRAALRRIDVAWNDCYWPDVPGVYDNVARIGHLINNGLHNVDLANEGEVHSQLSGTEH